MSETNVKVIQVQKCNRCGHEWWPRSADLPKRCPKCISQYWNKERVRKVGPEAARSKKADGAKAAKPKQ